MLSCPPEPCVPDGALVQVEVPEPPGERQGGQADQGGKQPVRQLLVPRNEPASQGMCWSNAGQMEAIRELLVAISEPAGQLECRQVLVPRSEPTGQGTCWSYASQSESFLWPA